MGVTLKTTSELLKSSPGWKGCQGNVTTFFVGENRNVQFSERATADDITSLSHGKVPQEDFSQ